MKNYHLINIFIRRNREMHTDIKLNGIDLLIGAFIVGFGFSAGKILCAATRNICASKLKNS